MLSPSFEDIEALNSMTLQVGLVGIGGLVLVSDRLSTGWEGEIDRGLSITSKFRLGNGFACCWSGDDIAQFAAANICKIKLQLKGTLEQRREIIRKELQKAGTKAWKQVFGRQITKGTNGTIRKVIAACPDGSLWLLEFRGRFPMANPRYDRVVAGDIRNSAAVFINNYLPLGEAPIPLPLNRLVFAAAHAVLVGAIENPSGIRGIEVVVIPTGGPPIFMTPEQENELKRRSERLGLTIREQLLQGFDYDKP